MKHSFFPPLLFLLLGLGAFFGLGAVQWHGQQQSQEQAAQWWAEAKASESTELPQPIQPQPPVAKKHKSKKAHKGHFSQPGPPAPKTQLTAFLLCFFLGVLGAHRFYLGYYGIGLLQLLTLGCCGIWTVVDLILIISGELKTADGARLVPWGKESEEDLNL